MVKLAQSSKRSLIVVLAVTAVMAVPNAYGAAQRVECTSILGVGATTAILGTNSAFFCADILENTNPDSPAGKDHYQDFVGGGWIQVTLSLFNSDSSGNQSFQFDGFDWTSSGGFNSSNPIEAAWALDIAADQDPSTETPVLPKVYDLLVVVGKGTGNAADSVGYLLDDFSFSGSASGRISAGFGPTRDAVTSLIVYARTLDEPPTGRVPEPSSLLLLILAGLAAVGMNLMGSNTRSTRL